MSVLAMLHAEQGLHETNGCFVSQKNERAYNRVEK
jgi:hypothetical protein